MFFDFESGNVYRPFEKKITLYRCFPGRCSEKETELSTDDVHIADVYEINLDLER